MVMSIWVPQTETWLTPPWIREPLGRFDIDPCCPDTMPWPTAKRMICQPRDGLKAKWKGRVWLNPPYNRTTSLWVEKLIRHVAQGSSGIAMIFARTDTALWNDLVFPVAKAVLFLRGRVKFCLPDGTLPKRERGESGKQPQAPSALIAYGPGEAAVLRSSGLAGSFVRLRR